MAHTPTPWKAGRTDMQSYLFDTGEPVHYVYRPSDGADTRIQIRGDSCVDDALFIVKAVNNYDELRWTLQDIINSLPNNRDWLDPVTEARAKDILGKTVNP